MGSELDQNRYEFRAFDVSQRRSPRFGVRLFGWHLSVITMTRCSRLLLVTLALLCIPLLAIPKAQRGETLVKQAQAEEAPVQRAASEQDLRAAAERRRAEELRRIEEDRRIRQWQSWGYRPGSPECWTEYLKHDECERRVRERRERQWEERARWQAEIRYLAGRGECWRLAGEARRECEREAVHRRLGTGSPTAN